MFVEIWNQGYTIFLQVLHCLEHIVISDHKITRLLYITTGNLWFQGHSANFSRDPWSRQCLPQLCHAGSAGSACQWRGGARNCGTSMGQPGKYTRGFWYCSPGGISGASSTIALLWAVWLPGPIQVRFCATRWLFSHFWLFVFVCYFQEFPMSPVTLPAMIR